MAKLCLCPAARLRYAQLLLERGDTARARDILEDGMRYAYTDDDYILPYFALTARLREQAGERERASELRRRIEKYLVARERRRLRVVGDGIGLASSMPLPAGSPTTGPAGVRR